MSADSTRDAFEEDAELLGSELRDAVEQAGARMHDGLGRAAEWLEDGRDALDDGLDRARRAVEDAGRRAARAVSGSSEYFRTRDAREVVRDVEALVSEHPGKSLLAMAAVGFLVGRAFRRRG